MKVSLKFLFLASIISLFAFASVIPVKAYPSKSELQDLHDLQSSASQQRPGGWTESIPNVEDLQKHYESYIGCLETAYRELREDYEEHSLSWAEQLIKLHSLKRLPRSADILMVKALQNRQMLEDFAGVAVLHHIDVFLEPPQQLQQLQQNRGRRHNVPAGWGDFSPKVIPSGPPES